MKIGLREGAENAHVTPGEVVFKEFKSGAGTKAASIGGDASNSSGTFTEGRDVGQFRRLLKSPRKTYVNYGFKSC